MKRETVFQKIIEKQNLVIENLMYSVDRYKSASNLDEDDTPDPDDLARQTQAKDMQLRYEKMLEKEKRDLNFVLSEIENKHEEFGLGAIVETDKCMFFSGVSLPPFKIDDKEMYCISQDAPIYAKLKGKRIGDTFMMGKSETQILDIY